MQHLTFHNSKTLSGMSKHHYCVVCHYHDFLHPRYLDNCAICFQTIMPIDLRYLDIKFYCCLFLLHNFIVAVTLLVAHHLYNGCWGRGSKGKGSAPDKKE